MSPRNREYIKRSLESISYSRWFRYPVIIILFMIMLAIGCWNV